MEAARCVCWSQRYALNRPVHGLAERAARRKGHPRAIGAAAERLATAACYVLSEEVEYREAVTVRSTGA